MSLPMQPLWSRLAALFEGSLAPADAAQSLLFFIHLPKTGGTSITSVLRRVYGRHYLNVGKRGRELGKDGAVDWTRVHCCSGHLHSDWTDGLRDASGRSALEHREVRKVCVVREPVSRVISYFRYVTTTPQHRLHAATQGMSAEQFFDHLEKERCGECWNQQARMLRGQEDSLFLAAPLDRVDVFIETLADACRWRKRVDVPRINTSAGAAAKGVPDSVRDLIRERSKIDIALYEAITARFENGDFPAQKLSARVAASPLP